MSKTKSLSDLVLSLQSKNQRLQLLGKYFNKICKSEFGYSVADLHKILDEYNEQKEKSGDFESEISGLS